MQMNFNLPESTALALSQFAQQSHRSPDEILDEALQAYLQDEREHYESLIRALAEIDAGLLIPHQQVMEATLPR